MNKAQRKKFDSLYNEHISALQRQGKAPNTIDAYSRALGVSLSTSTAAPNVSVKRI